MTMKNLFLKGCWPALAVLALLVIVARPLTAQSTTGTISGVVRDSSQAVIPGVAITVTNLETGQSRSGVTEADGAYKFPALPAGTYEIRVQHQGFQRETRTGLRLAVGQDAAINLTLQVGEVEQTVAVTAEAPLVETSTANVSGLVSEGEVHDLPLNARNLLELAALFPGITVAVQGGATAIQGFGTKLAISGTRYTSNLFQVDGQDINDSGGTTGSAAGILMGAETIREFNVIVNGYSAEYGKHSGGVFNAITKSGSNSLHGSLFEFLRNNKLDARNFFDKTIPAYKRNQFGFALGGPIVKDRTFFFGSYEALRERLGLTTLVRVPDAGARTGRLPNPTTGAVQTIAVNPKVQPFLNSYPLPNGRNFEDGTGEFGQVLSLPTTENFYTVRIDHTFSEKDSLFGRYTFDDGSRGTDASINSSLLSNSRSQYAAVSETRLFSPHVINVLLWGYKRSSNGIVPEQKPGFTFPLQNFTGLKDGLGAITVTGLGLWGGPASEPELSSLNEYQVTETVLYTKARNAYKFGFNFQRMMSDRTSASQGAGNYTFTSLANFMQGTVNQLRAIRPGSDPTAKTRQSLFGFYAQDDLSLSSRLTLNLGLRYEFVTTIHVLKDRVSNLRNPWTPGQTPANLALGNPMYENPSLKNFAPRFGFAWDPTGTAKTSIRGGIGVFYDQLLPGLNPLSFTNTPPFGGSFTLRGAGVLFPDQYATLTTAALSALPPDVEAYQFNPKQSTVYKYSVNVEREIVTNTSVDVGYSASRGVHLIRVLNSNNPVAQLVNGRLFVPSNAPLLQPPFGRVRTRNSDVTSDYHSLRLQVNQRNRHGLTARVAYTFSKTIDEGSNYLGATDWNNSPGQSRYQDLKERGLAAFDIRHALTTNFTYDLPGKNLKGAAAKLAGGWQLSGVLTAQTGSPFNISSGFIPSWMSAGFVGGYPDLIAGAKVKYDTRNPNRYFSPSAFTLAPNGIIGNLARDFGSAPGISKLDLVVVKNTRLFEWGNLQFRSEFFNLLNRANFGLPASAIFATSGSGAFDSTVGRITGTNTISRQIQFGLKLEF